MAKARFELPVQSGKIVGQYITADKGARIDGGGGIFKVLFKATETQEILYKFEMPDNYASGLKVIFKYAMASASSGKIDMEAKIMATAEGEDIDRDAFDSLNEISGGTTVPGTAGDRDTIELTMANDDSVAAGESVYLHIQRDHDDADDTATGDLELIGLEIEYTTT